MVAALQKIKQQLNQISTANFHLKAPTQKPPGPTIPIYTKPLTPATNTITRANINLSVPTFPSKLLNGECELL
jgi:hypothetical protein